MVLDSVQFLMEVVEVILEVVVVLASNLVTRVNFGCLFWRLVLDEVKILIKGLIEG